MKGIEELMEVKPEIIAMDATTELSRDIASKGIYPAVDPLS